MEDWISHKHVSRHLFSVTFHQFSFIRSPSCQRRTRWLSLLSVLIIIENSVWWMMSSWTWWQNVHRLTFTLFDMLLNAVWLLEVMINIWQTNCFLVLCNCLKPFFFSQMMIKLLFLDHIKSIWRVCIGFTRKCWVIYTIKDATKSI